MNIWKLIGNILLALVVAISGTSVQAKGGRSGGKSSGGHSSSGGKHGGHHGTNGGAKATKVKGSRASGGKANPATKPQRSSTNDTGANSDKGRQSDPGPGTGSKQESTGVSGYTKKNGEYVAPHRRSTPDQTTDNNWSTKPNSNPYTGKEGSRTNP